MKTLALFFAFLSLLPCCFSNAQEKSKVDWENEFQQLIKSDPGVLKKFENGQATKKDVIQWLQQKQGGKKNVGVKQPMAKDNVKKVPNALQTKLKELVESGKLSKEDAAKLAATMNGEKSEKGNANQKDKVDWDAAYEQLLKNRPDIRKKVEDGNATKEQVIGFMKNNAAGKGKAAGQNKAQMKSPRKRKAGDREGSLNFYAIVIGRLKSKDIELGEMEIDVEYVISELPRLNSDLIGTRVKLVGVSGQFLDALLQIKRGETIKVRAGDFNPKTKVLGFGNKFQVLERTAKFQPGDFGIPPTEFRGFKGEITGEIVNASGYEVLLKVQESKPSDDNKAKDAESVLGKRIRIAGFYNQHREAFADLGQGEKIRVSVDHRNLESDALNVTETLNKLKK